MTLKFHAGLYINLCIIFLTSGYALTTTTYSPLLYSLCFVGSCFILIESSYKKFAVDRRVLIYITIIFSFLLVTSSVSSVLNVSSENTNSLIKFIFVVFFCFLFCLLYNVRTAVRAFLNIFILLCVISLFVYFSVNIFSVDIGLPKITNSNGVTYNVGFFFMYFEGFLQYRNISVFWEPGIFSTFIILSLFLELYFFKNSRKFRILILFLSLLTTFSSSAIVLLFLYFISYGLHSNFKLSIRQVFYSVAAVLVLSSVAYIAFGSAENLGVDPYRVFNKLLNPGETEGHRIMSPINAFEVFTLKPIFGWGLSEGLGAYLSIDKISLTSTSFFYLSAFGIFGVSYALLIIVGGLYLKELSYINRILIILLIFIVINKEPHIYFTITYVFLFYLIINAFKSVKNKP